MNRFSNLCASWLILGAITTALTGCGFESKPTTHQPILFDQLLQLAVTQAPEHWSGAQHRQLREQLTFPPAQIALLDWGLKNPGTFERLLQKLESDQAYIALAEQAIANGKGFLLIERFGEHQDYGIAKLVRAIRNLEQQDQRRKLTNTQVFAAPALESIAQLSGEHQGVKWQGAAFLVSESDCQLGFLTAGHNLIGAKGSPKALEHSQLRLKGQTYQPRLVAPYASPALAENDWVLLVADKVPCTPERFDGLSLIEEGHELNPHGEAAELYCFHQGPQDVMPALYAEACTLYPAEAGVLDLYREKPPGTLGIHGCQSDPGSSGCPLLINRPDSLSVIGIQIEGDRKTGAGIVRLIDAQVMARVTG